MKSVNLEKWNPIQIHLYRSIASAIFPSRRSRCRLLGDAGPNAQFAFEEFFFRSIRNRHTRTAYMRSVRQFLEWTSGRNIALTDIQPGTVGTYFDQLTLSLPTKKLHLSALRSFFNVMVNRHVMILNPAATVRCERYHVVEGKTPEISRDQARQLLAAIDDSRPVGKRDKAIVATLIYTAARAGASPSTRPSRSVTSSCRRAACSPRARPTG